MASSVGSPEDSNADFIRLADKYVEVPSGKNVSRCFEL